MIVSEFDPERGEGRIVLRPNRSWTWRANTLLVGTLMAVSGSVATVYAYHGLWLILPFTFIEMSFLLACLYYCVRRTHLQEVLTFSPEHLVFERGVGHPDEQRCFQRYFARFFVRRPRHPWYRNRIALRCRGEELEVGGFLPPEERDDLIDVLRDMIDRLDQLPPRAGPQGARQ
jgi:uncharacterized membrane protein